MITKLQIAKFLVVLGFVLSIANYGLGLVTFYSCDEEVSFVLEEAGESSEEKDNEQSEQEDTKEKDKISQDNIINHSGLVDSYFNLYPDFYVHNTSVYLEHKTPPPEIS
ncbi:hypothetical protein [Aquimarina sp. 2201CG5-10]|uniref:hypothetical protein n=1 Tax=Aquimarina callyspongiae TaxID=3098150 RepID=UPI002AB35388|nr:hypothetical protein [Aquimarina sp. 2201CG5-10]MDY8138770.1 hypothetical protein [Aquimarina sp. 2201CG5-10]